MTWELQFLGATNYDENERVGDGIRGADVFSLASLGSSVPSA